MTEGWEALRDGGQYVTTVRVTIIKVYTHPADTPADIARACGYYGRRFVGDFLVSRCVQIPHRVQGREEHSSERTLPKP